LLAEAERLARATGATALTVGVRIALPDNVRYFVARTASARSAARRIPASTTRPRSTWPSGWIRGWIIRETKTSRDRGQKIHCHGEPGGPRLDA
ncbi:MAG TPA: hypothetical protein VKU84_04095, partial [Stellaceae bacterium]|nr:hypothetical protein [Stellaceae bacterium]